ncbi:MAG: transcription elongation factor GreA [Candidatus Sungbacteria bacterium RIFCSPHIGHO2_02_FULL_47_11]|uniref:Transcription elongation factor GreA n=1 Tax=Candidatus Sungbacteria bacterium RIFCSPHIGHO2_02_FULL_47_11 TaxID=1802270 RepID=A0A1G2KIF7_9BACT|nr:MAG: transcription elongation factor GreA [Candidatus Sungbacteria bacterium RIFCSPHIGHO2_02_FULL_47_11]
MSEYFSKEGFEKLKQELEELKTVKRKEIAKRLEHAKSLGDLSENAEYQETKEEQSLVETHIADIEERIRNVVLIAEGRRTDTVVVGATVRVRSNDGEEIFVIVGSEEARPAEGKISNESPLGKSFLGHKAGESVEARTPGGVVVYEIMEIR